MPSSDSMFRQEYEDESSTGKLGRKAKDSPFMPVGESTVNPVVFLQSEGHGE